MMCGPHLQGYVQQAQLARGSYCEFWLPRTRWHQTATLLCAALCCHDQTDERWVRGRLQAFYLVHRWRRFLRLYFEDAVCCSEGFRPLLSIMTAPCVNIQCTILTERKSRARSEAQIYEPFSANAA